MIQNLYAWIYLPHKIEPVLCGRLWRDQSLYCFQYDENYLNNNQAIAINPIELPLVNMVQQFSELPNSLRDSAPDFWGRRVLLNIGSASEDDDLSFLISSCDRIGAIDFQLSKDNYISKKTVSFNLIDLIQSVDKVLNNIPLSIEEDFTLINGSTIGGDRPKALIESNDCKYIAKFSTSLDLFSYVKAEYIAMQLAEKVGLTVAETQYTQCLGRDVLLVKRFDREKSTDGWTRQIVLSALTLLQLTEMEARYASYEDLAGIIRTNFPHARMVIRELYSRMTFNILIGNTDDHARNHAFLWDGLNFNLAPAYDICPQGRTGYEATQAMLISGTNRSSTLETCLVAAPIFGLEKKEAISIISNQIQGILDHWDFLCNETQLSENDRQLLWGRQFLNPYAFIGDLPDEIKSLQPKQDNFNYSF